jgi:hypothetical protein
MKSKISLIFAFIFLFKLNVKSQSTEDLVSAGAGLLTAGISAAILIDQYKEYLELNATEYILSNHKEFKDFKLKVLDLEGVKLFDLSNMSCVTFYVESISENLRSVKEKKILMMFTSSGWCNNNGINFSKVRYHLLGKDDWNDMYKAYCNLAIDRRFKLIVDKNIIPFPKKIWKENFKENDSNYIKITNESFTEIYYKYEDYDISESKLTSSGISIKSISEPGNFIPFVKLDGDSYLTIDYSSKFKLAYNENCMGIFLKDLTRLSQIKRSTMNKIHEFIN